jgi:hypothetical protein
MVMGAWHKLPPSVLVGAWHQLPVFLAINLFIALKDLVNLLGRQP